MNAHKYFLRNNLSNDILCNYHAEYMNHEAELI